MDRQRQRTEILTEELYKVRNQAEQESGRSVSRIRELEDSLRTYVALEAELDDVVMQAAEAADADEVGLGCRGYWETKSSLSYSPLDPGHLRLWRQCADHGAAAAEAERGAGAAAAGQQEGGGAGRGEPQAAAGAGAAAAAGPGRRPPPAGADGAALCVLDREHAQGGGGERGGGGRG